MSQKVNYLFIFARTVHFSISFVEFTKGILDIDDQYFSAFF